MNIIPVRINHEVLKFPEHSINLHGPNLQTFDVLYQVLKILTHRDVFSELSARSPIRGDAGASEGSGDAVRKL